MFFRANQSHDQQLIDESDWYDAAQSESGVDPEMGAAVPPSSADFQDPQAQGGRVGARGSGRLEAPSSAESRVMRVKALPSAQQSVRCVEEGNSGRPILPPRSKPGTKQPRDFNRTIRNRRLPLISRSEISSAHFLPVWMHAVIQ